MACCGGSKSDDETSDGFGGKVHKCRDLDSDNLNFTWNPTIKNVKKIAYVRQLERRYERLQWAYFNLRVDMAHLQGCLRQIVDGDSCERAKVIEEVKRKGFKKVDCDTLSCLEQHHAQMGNLQTKQNLLMACLRQRIGSLEKAADELENENNVLSKKKQTLHSLTSDTPIKASQSTTSKGKEASTIKITKYEDKPQPETASTSPKTKPEKAKKPNKFKKNSKVLEEAAKSTKKEDTKNARSSGGLSKAKSSDLVSKKSAKSAETLSSGQSIISTRSASFKELKAKYQGSPDRGK